MIREIINFTNDLLSDYPEIEQIKQKLDPGLHVFVDIDSDGNWTNTQMVKGKDYDFYDGKNSDIDMWNECIRHQEASYYITMNKVKRFDPKQKIHSCSPFSVAFNFNFSEEDRKRLGIPKASKQDSVSKEEKEIINKKIREERWKVIQNDSIENYIKNSKSIYAIEETDLSQKVDAFFAVYKEVVEYVISNVSEYSKLKDKDYLHVYLRTVPIEVQEKLHNSYVEENILNNLNKIGMGTVGFYTVYNDKKPFLCHVTGISEKGQVFTKKDALILDKFENMLKRKCFPNPLPIVIDKRELNKKIIKLFNESEETLPYSELIKGLFDDSHKQDLPCYYLLNYSGMKINELDFVPSFRYSIDQKIENVMDSGYTKNGVFEKDPDKSLRSIFDFERVVVKTIFNNSLVKIKDNSYTTNYFGEVKPEYVIGGHAMWQLIMKYRQAIYDFIYKSRTNAITTVMFDDMMYESIMSNVRYDKIKERFSSNNYYIKDKLNIWFSLCMYFENLNKNKDMSKVKELKERIRAIANGEACVETPEEFAFAAGQLVSYLIDRSAASEKDYSLLEPYLQKAKSSQLQDAIAHTVTIYKHDIKVYKGKFEALASNVLADGQNIEMKPLLKYFLAGCFSDCVIYEKKLS